MLDQVFHKTVAGQAELSEKTHGLSPTQRRLLIMLDGKKALKDCAPYFRESDDLPAMIKVLSTLKLIEGGNKDPWQTTTIIPSAEATPQIVAARATTQAMPPAVPLPEMIKRAVRYLTDQLGPEAEISAMRIESAKSLDAFNAALRPAVDLLASIKGREAGVKLLEVVGLKKP
ncbi:MAG: hypothetical protein RL341_434 [Pseudomonadota bacterium]|jgi:hypothetical protein